MNRKQRRSEQKELRRNSKKNFVDCGYAEIPIDKIEHDPNLKECDMEVVELISHRFDWAEKGLVSNDLSKCIIMKGCSYLDVLCSLRFDITPPDDKALIRDTMYYIGNYTNMMIGMLLDEEYDAYNIYNKSISENIYDHQISEDHYINMPLVHASYPFVSLPNKEIVDDLYASFIAEHAQELSKYLQGSRKSDIADDKEYILEVLIMILKKTDELLPEAQVNSRKFIVEL